MKAISAVHRGSVQLSDADAALLVSAHLDLLQAQSEGTTVLGSVAGSELVNAAHEHFHTRVMHALLEVAA